MSCACRTPRCGVQRQVDDQILGSVNEETAEGLAGLNGIDAPAARSRCRDELITDAPDIAAIGAGEEVQVLRRSRRETMCKQCTSPGEQETVAGRQTEQQARDLDLERGQRRRTVEH